MVTKPMNAFKFVRVYYIIHLVCLVHVLATLVAILTEVHYKGYITKVFEPMHKCKTLTCVQSYKEMKIINWEQDCLYTTE